MRICGRVFDTTGAEYRYRLKFDQYYGIRYFYDVLVAWYQRPHMNAHPQETFPCDFGCSAMLQTRSAAQEQLF